MKEYILRYLTSVCPFYHLMLAHLHLFDDSV